MEHRSRDARFDYQERLSPASTPNRPRSPLPKEEEEVAVSVIGWGGSLSLVGEKQGMSDPVTNQPCHRIAVGLGARVSWTSVGPGRGEPQNIISMVDSTCLQEAEVRERGEGAFKKVMGGSPQDGVECLQMRLLGSWWGRIPGLLQLQRRTPCPSLKTCPQPAPRR